MKSPWALATSLLLCCLPALSQTTTGRILGSVEDQTEAVVPRTTVLVTDVQRGVTRTVVTDQAGEYVAADLAPGLYRVRVEAKGFETVERLQIQLEVAQDLRLDFVLHPGQVSQVITVQEQTPLIDTTSSTLGGTLSNETINDLPLNGRNYENLLQLRPGVVRYPGGGFSTTSTNGLRAEDNAYIIDGLFNSEPFSGQSIINGAGIAGDSATILPIDAIQEFNLQENPPAEYGWKPGAIVNVGLKSGTNHLHGTAYYFGRNGALDARNFFNPAPEPKTPRRLNQFGGTAGGPIIRDKLFFFAGYEGQRYSVGNSAQVSTPATVPLAGDTTNSIPDAIAGIEAQGITPSAVSLRIGGCTLGPLVTCNGKGFPANNGTNPAGPSTITIGYPNTVHSDNAVGKVDYHVSERHTLNGMYFFGNNSGTVDDAAELQPQWLTEIHTRAQVAGTNWTWVPGSTWVNEARFGYNRLYQPTFTVDHNQPASMLGVNTGVTNPLYGGLPRIKINGFNLPEELGGFNWPKVQGPDTRFQFVDHVSHTRGNHALKLGGEVHHDGFNGGAYGGGRGVLQFVGGSAFPGSTALEDFFAGLPGRGSLLIGDPTRHIHNWSYGAFLQDDWRVTRNLTLNLGLRYEYNSVIHEDDNLLGNFDPNVGLVQVGKQIGSPDNGDHTNFAPRLGLAWDPTGSGRTVIRAGGGLFYEQLNWESFLAFNNTLGLNTVPTGAVGVQPGGGTIAVGNITFPSSALSYNAGPVFPSGAIDCSPVTGSPCTTFAIDPNLTTPYVYDWTVNVQHAFTNNLSLQLAYVGNHGSNLVGIRDINQVVPVKDDGSEQLGRPFNAQFPFLAFIYQMSNIYRSNYNGLQATLTARNVHGLSFVAGYTYAHALDDVGANWDFGAGLGLPQDSTHPQLEYASSDFDMRHRLTLSVTYAIPGKKSFGQLLEGWQLNSIVTLASAQPWGPIDAGDDVSRTGEFVDRWDFVGKPSDFQSGPNGIPCFGFGGGPCDPTIPAACISAATALGPSVLAALQTIGGCYMKGNSMMIPPALGTFGTMGRNVFRDSGFDNWDLSVAKNWKIVEQVSAQFRGEFFNFLNHPNFANPFGGQNGWAHNDPSAPGAFGCACATPDVAASNPVIGSGGSRAIQLSLKLIF